MSRPWEKVLHFCRLVVSKIRCTMHMDFFSFQKLNNNSIPTCLQIMFLHDVHIRPVARGVKGVRRLPLVQKLEKGPFMETNLLHIQHVERTSILLYFQLKDAPECNYELPKFKQFLTLCVLEIVLCLKASQH